MSATRLLTGAIERAGEAIVKAEPALGVTNKLATEALQTLAPTATRVAPDVSKLLRGAEASVGGTVASSVGKIEARASVPAAAQLISEMDQSYAVISRPGLVYRGGAPAVVPRHFVDTSLLGQTIQAAEQRSAVYARLNAAGDEFTRGSGFVVRPDGLTLTALHPLKVRGYNGDIYLRPLGHPHTVRARILDESPAEDLALLKPMVALPTQRHIPLAAFSDSTPTGNSLVTVGVQRVDLSATNHLTGAIHISEGRVLGRDPVRFAGQLPTERIRTDVTGEYGMSGAPTFDVNSQKLIGAMLGGNDYKWSGLAPASKIRSLIQRNWTR